MHALLLDVSESHYRKGNVGVMGQSILFPEPDEVPALMDAFVEWLYHAQSDCRQGVISPLELATRAHFYFVNIHPFEDGNGRMARVLTNILLTKHGWTPALISADMQEQYFHALARGRSGELDLLAEFLASSVACGLHGKYEFVKHLRD